jgi:uncharacterized protein (DUF58 family)
MTAAVLEASLFLLYLDPLIALLSALLAGILLLEMISIFVRVREVERKVPSEEKSVRLSVGEERLLNFAVKIPSFVSLRAGERWAEVRVQDGVQVKLRPELFGIHTIRIEYSIFSRLGVFEASGLTGLRVKAVVNPRALPLIIQAVEGIYEQAAAGIGERGIVEPGFEYKGTREYRPEDRLRRVDWRATARGERIYIKEFAGGSGGIVLVVNGEAPGPRTADFTASALLTAALTAYRENLAVNLMRISHSSIQKLGFLSPAEALRAALNLSLEELGLGYDAIEHIIPRPTASKLEILRRLGLDEVAEALRPKVLEASEAAANASGIVVIVGTLVSNAQSLLDLISELHRAGADVLIATHPRPWVDARSAGEEKLLKETQRRMERALASSSRIFHSYTRLQEELCALLLRSRWHGS